MTLCTALAVFTNLAIGAVTVEVATSNATTIFTDAVVAVAVDVAFVDTFAVFADASVAVCG